ncbi:MAG: class I tRNA ligase family protein, partial [Oscillibacter sp.]|nr:class I tRNA ligase family protein [Oscillibacter sp.]
MVGKYFGGTLPEGCSAPVAPMDCDADLKAMAQALRASYEASMESYAPHTALAEVFKVIQRANKYIDETAPWALAKDMEANGARLAHVLYNLLEATRICAILLIPFMPESMEKLFGQIGASAEVQTWESAAEWAKLPETVTVTKGENLFPRIDAEKALAELAEAEAEAKKALLPPIEIEPYAEEKVDFDTFCRSDFRAVKVKACEAVKKSAKLLKFTLDDGTGVDRQILSGIHAFYEPEELIGKTLVAIVNLPPRKMMGQESCGMLLSAVHTEKGEEKLNLIMVDDKIPAGAKLC